MNRLLGEMPTMLASTAIAVQTMTWDQLEKSEQTYEEAAQAIALKRNAMRNLPLFAVQVKQSDSFIRALRLLLAYVREEMQARHEAHEAALELMHKGEMC